MNTCSKYLLNLPVLLLKYEEMYAFALPIGHGFPDRTEQFRQIRLRKIVMCKLRHWATHSWQVIHDRNPQIRQMREKSI
jgi:hypothetical protein